MSRGSAAALCVLTFAVTSISCPAAKRILLDRLGPTQATVFVSNADGSGERVLTHSESLDYDPSWSVKGDWIVFTSERAGSADLYRIHPDGTGLEGLTSDPAYDDQGAFSPDGKRIVFVSTRANGRANLWILDTATRKAVPLTSENGGDFRPSWSPDGNWIAFSSDRGSSLPPAEGRWERLQLADIYLVIRTAAGCDASPNTEDSAAVPNGRVTARRCLRIACRRRIHMPTALLRRTATTNWLRSTLRLRIQQPCQPGPVSN